MRLRTRTVVGGGCLVALCSARVRRRATRSRRKASSGHYPTQLFPAQATVLHLALEGTTRFSSIDINAIGRHHR